MREELKKHLIALIFIVLLIIAAILCTKAVYWMLWAVLALLCLCVIVHFAATVYKNSLKKQQLSNTISRRLEPIADKILELTGFIESLPQSIGGPTAMLLSMLKNIAVVFLNKIAHRIKNKK